MGQERVSRGSATPQFQGGGTKQPQNPLGPPANAHRSRATEFGVITYMEEYTCL